MNIKQSKVTIGGPETTPGTAVARQYVLPLRDMAEIDNEVETSEDPVIIARNMMSDEYVMATSVQGGIPLSPRPCGGFGKAVKSLLGKEVLKQGYQELGLTGKTGASDTLLTASTAYNFKVTVDGGTQTNCSITTGAGPTIDYDELLTLLNAEMTAQGLACYFYLWGGDIRCTSDSYYSPSTIDIAAGDTSDLLAALDGGATPDTAVPGAPLQVSGAIRLRYIGSDASCKLTSDQSVNSLTSSTGAKGSESPDAGFGTAGVVDFDLAAFDTLGEVVTALNGYADYECQKVFGGDSLDLTTNMVMHGFFGQGKDTWAYIYFESTGSGVYSHILEYDTGFDELPVYSYQKDHNYDNFLYGGIVSNSLSLSGNLKAMMEAELDTLGLNETIGQTASGLELEDIDPMIFSEGSTSFGAKEYTFISSISLDLNNQHNPEGYGQGDKGRLYHRKGVFQGSGEMQVRMDADSYAERAKIFQKGVKLSVSFYIYGKDITTDIPEYVIVELPYCRLSSHKATNNGGHFDANMQFKVRYPKGTNYNNPVRVHMLTQDSEEY